MVDGQEAQQSIEQQEGGQGPTAVQGTMRSWTRLDGCSSAVEAFLKLNLNQHSEAVITQISLQLHPSPLAHIEDLASHR